MSVFPFQQLRPRVRMPVRAALRLAPLGDIWHKPALSGVAALAVVLLALLLAGRLDLTLYASAGAMCALYGHGLPYAARAKALGWVVAGMLAGTTVALVTAALTESVAVRVAVAAVLAGVHKAACDASRIGPPGNVVLTFVAASAAFVPGERLAEVPLHVGLGVLGGVVAWVVGMAPGVVRPDGPERIAVARALEATARLASGAARGDDVRQARHAAATAVNAAWVTLLRAGDRREGLRRLLVRAESAAAACAGGRARGGVDAGMLAGWAHELRKGRPVPEPPACDARTEAAEQAELSGIAAERAEPVEAAGARWWRVAATVAAGAALAGWVSMALGVGRPYWAVVTAAAVFAANTTMSWSRALQRVIGNLLGVALFTALVPLTRWGAVALIVAVLVMQFVTEAAITRNYWLGSVFVAPMAMLMTEFAGAEPVSALVADRWLDTCLGAAAGLLACVLLPDRRAAARVRDGLERLERLLEEPLTGAARDRLRAALVELREAADIAAGEWWSAALPQERIAAAERAGHHRLAELTA
ncbi:FUSC family protein [Nonomuraea sp. PA05]|uniref:FUSC family protein n=1 Tax=Nonomuraea sp. PA05 TaxID=2604466 RepID=UPI0011DC0215|nr:FUSC family protein [Nonomuraea sp. PA05]TYB61829.1 FUSC family protein [Nonomuraea sp. PA05]